MGLVGFKATMLETSKQPLLCWSTGTQNWPKTETHRSDSIVKSDQMSQRITGDSYTGRSEGFVRLLLVTRWNSGMQWVLHQAGKGEIPLPNHTQQLQEEQRGQELRHTQPRQRSGDGNAQLPASSNPFVPWELMFGAHCSSLVKTKGQT